MFRFWSYLFCIIKIFLHMFPKCFDSGMINVTFLILLKDKTYLLEVILLDSHENCIKSNGKLCELKIYSSIFAQMNNFDILSFIDDKYNFVLSNRYVHMMQCPRVFKCRIASLNVCYLLMIAMLLVPSNNDNNKNIKTPYI